MDVNDNAGRLTLRSALRFFAGKPAPTLIALLLSFSAHAFDLQQLSDQLGKPS
ncbi:MAG: outer membrane lipoprotein carrier protein LolA, partial [Pseudomonas sp.]|nr:outer membrane lipoprotein carrier protein LolA [Pseudomonas sp.]